MQYALLIYEDEKRWNNMSPEEIGKEVGQYRTFGEEFSSAIKGGNALQPTPTAKTVRVREGKPVVVDGPFAETKEHLGGFYLVEAESIERATEMAAKIPGARFGSIEARPIQVFS